MDRSSQHAGFAAGIAAALITAAGVADASLPAPVAAAGYPVSEVGRGELRYFGFAIYDASLWAPQGRFSGFIDGQPVALSLWYKRSFSRTELIEITLKAWRKLGATTEQQRRDWAEQLDGMWTHVAGGDNLTAVVLPGSETRFYDDERLLGIIDDPAFGPAFLGIWLDPASVVGDLRTELLGLEESAAR